MTSRVEITHVAANTNELVKEENEIDIPEFNNDSEKSIMTSLPANLPVKKEREAEEEEEFLPFAAVDVLPNCGEELEVSQGEEDSSTDPLKDLNIGNWVPVNSPCREVLSHEELGLFYKRNRFGEDSSNARELDYESGRHMEIPTRERPYPCKVCKMCFTSTNVLAIHMRSHTGERPYPCKVCKKCFISSSNLSVHMRSHTEERPYPCTVCKKGFKTRSNLSAHVWSHNGERAFPCKVCKKGFISSSHILVHMRSHTGEKPYPCNVCKKGFTARRYLPVHLRNHTGERSFLCKVF